MIDHHAIHRRFALLKLPGTDMKKRPGRRKKGWRVIDLRGLTSQERQLDAIVTLGCGRYRVVEIDEGARVAVLEPEGDHVNDD